MSAQERERLAEYAQAIMDRDKTIASLNARIEQLAGMVNRYSHQLGLGRKVRAEDWAAYPPKQKESA